MDLREFVKETLVQVCDGVRAAQETARESGSTISPETRQYARERQRLVEFDVAVTVVEEGEKSGKAGLAVFGQGVGGILSKSNSTTEASRVRFSVPVLFASVEPPAEEDPPIASMG